MLSFSSSSRSTTSKKTENPQQKISILQRLSNAPPKHTLYPVLIPGSSSGLTFGCLECSTTLAPLKTNKKKFGKYIFQSFRGDCHCGICGFVSPLSRETLLHVSHSHGRIARGKFWIRTKLNKLHTVGIVVTPTVGNRKSASVRPTAATADPPPGLVCSGVGIDPPPPSLANMALADSAISEIFDSFYNHPPGLATLKYSSCAGRHRSARTAAPLTSASAQAALDLRGATKLENVRKAKVEGRDRKSERWGWTGTGRMREEGERARAREREGRSDALRWGKGKERVKPLSLSIVC